MNASTPSVPPTGFIRRLMEARTQNRRLKRLLEEQRRKYWNLSQQLRFYPMKSLRFFCVCLDEYSPE